MFAYGSTARTLDDRRLGIQKDQTLEILNGLTLEEEIPDHPVYRMWIGYEYALAIYGMFLCMEWTMHRKFKDTVFWELGRAIEEMGGSYEHPPWLRDKDLIRSHRSNLMRRWPRNYSWPGTPQDLPYLWPVNLFDVRTSEPAGYELMVSSEELELLKAGERTLPRRMRERVVNL
jgi:hypothetical protein